MREFVMGDIHGAYKALKQCLENARFDYLKDRLIQLGDITDRHGEVYECIEELLKIKNLVSIRGNHDDWFDEFCQTGRHPANWIHGGIATVRSYLKHFLKKRLPTNLQEYEMAALLKPGHIPEKHVRFFANMLLYHIDENSRCYVHGGFNRFLPFTGQSPSTYYWDRELWKSTLEWQIDEKSNPDKEPFKIKTRFKEIFIGHTPTTLWNISVPMNGANVYNLDTGAGQAGRLTIMEVETKEFWQSDPVGELYPNTLVLN